MSVLLESGGWVAAEVVDWCSPGGGELGFCWVWPGNPPTSGVVGVGAGSAGLASWGVACA